ncbi:MAG: hypothetical protein ACKOTZ_06610 [Chloroflexota bacterium]
MTAILRYDPETGPTLEEILIYEEPLYRDDELPPPEPPRSGGCLVGRLLVLVFFVAFMVGAVRSCLPG